MNKRRGRFLEVLRYTRTQQQSLTDNGRVMAISRVAKVLGLPQKGLYRRWGMPAMVIIQIAFIEVFVKSLRGNFRTPKKNSRLIAWTQLWFTMSITQLWVAVNRPSLAFLASVSARCSLQICCELQMMSFTKASIRYHDERLQHTFKTVYWLKLWSMTVCRQCCTRPTSGGRKKRGWWSRDEN